MGACGATKMPLAALCRYLCHVVMPAAQIAEGDLYGARQSIARAWRGKEREQTVPPTVPPRTDALRAFRVFMIDRRTAEI